MSIEAATILILGGGLITGITALLIRDWWRRLQPHDHRAWGKRAAMGMIGVIVLGATFPLFSRPKGCGGYIRSSITNLRQICTAMHLYADDPTNGRFAFDPNPARALLLLYPRYLTDYRALAIPGDEGTVKLKGIKASLNAGTTPFNSDIDYAFVQGCKQTDNDDILLYEKSPRNGTRAFALVDGSATVLPDGQFRKRLQKQLDRMNEPAGASGN